jgi:hypothetical protein
VRGQIYRSQGLSAKARTFTVALRPWICVRTVSGWGAGMRAL